MNARFLLSDSAPQANPRMEMSYIPKKQDWIAPAIEAFLEDRRNRERKPCIPVGGSQP